MAIHFTFANYPARVFPYVQQLERALAPFQARPHWGKLFTMDGNSLDKALPQLSAFRDYCRAVDPDGCFANSFTTRALAYR